MYIHDPHKKIPTTVLVAIEFAERRGARCAAWSDRGRGISKAYEAAQHVDSRLSLASLRRDRLYMIVPFALASDPDDVARVALTLAGFRRTRHTEHYGNLYLWHGEDAAR